MRLAAAQEITPNIEELTLKAFRITPRLGIAQINLHHAVAASAVITRKFTSEDLGIVLVQEPWVYKGQVKGLTEKSIKVIWDLSCDNPRTCVMLKKETNYFCISEFLTRDLVAIQLTVNLNGQAREVVFASAYFAGDAAIPPEEVRGLVEYS
ncbi:PREDICTED: uncharacterized protein LOC108355664 [Rhagoletis zephyria]|uniref:uncharacterized protein LOC108355664 n=1 Tax=Rhagoletis zephyria TaxID=28612 RepID=UPI00081158DB|nr:PREDICTED: uncharacterized protein LOC108355664 [Rhagoletis zephyria]